MKIVAGVVLAGTISAGVGPVASGGGAGRDGRPQASRAGTQGFGVEYYAWAVQMGHLDGPRREAMGCKTGSLDGEFNCFVGGRCIRAADDRVVTYLRNDYWTLDFGVDEGPAAFLPRLSPIFGTGYGQGIGGIIVKGLPWKGGDAGCVYAYSGSGIWRIWRNADKGDRWWFKRLAGAGALEIPGGRVYQGQIWRKWGEKEEKAVFFTKAGFYALEDDPAGAKLKPVLSIKSIEAHFPKNEKAKGRTAYPTLGVIDSGGSYYLGFYFAAYGSKTVPGVMRVSPDGKRVEPILTPPGGCGAKKNQDGPGMKTGWHCGPHFHPPKAVSPWCPPGILLCHAHDEHDLRRFRDGRVSTLYKDGEWREASKYDRKNFLMGAASFVLGPDGRALVGGGAKRKGDDGIYLVRGVDLDKPTVKDGKWGTSK